MKNSRRQVPGSELMVAVHFVNKKTKKISCLFHDHLKTKQMEFEFVVIVQNECLEFDQRLVKHYLTS